MLSCKKTSFKKLKSKRQGERDERRKQGGSVLPSSCIYPHLWHIQVKVPGHLRKEVAKMGQIPCPDGGKFNNSLSENGISNKC